LITVASLFSLLLGICPRSPLVLSQDVVLHSGRMMWRLKIKRLVLLFAAIAAPHFCAHDCQYLASLQEIEKVGTAARRWAADDVSPGIESD